MVLMSHIALAEEDGTMIVQQGAKVILPPNYGSPPYNNKTKQLKWYDWKKTDKESQRVTQKNQVKDRFKGRCLLVDSGALSFEQAQVSDSGNYSLQVYDHHGKLLYETQLQLLVLVKASSPVMMRDSHNTLIITVAVVTGLIALLIASIIFLILRKKRQQRMMTEGPREENVYVVMCGDRGERRTEKEGKSLEEEGGEESPYVICASIKPTTTRTSVSIEDIYSIV